MTRCSWATNEVVGSGAEDACGARWIRACAGGVPVLVFNPLGGSGRVT